jgi:hypothetical protein
MSATAATRTACSETILRENILNQQDFDHAHRNNDTILIDGTFQDGIL